MNTVADNEVFLFSSFMPNADRYFQGYCFVGPDYVFGDDGATAFEARRGKAVGPDEDGCYVSVRRVDDNYTFYVDFSGNKKLFYSWSPRYWAVSNSLSTLIVHLRSHDVPITPNFAQLLAAGYGQRSSALNQAVSYTTIVNEARLLPLGKSLTIGSRGFSISSNPVSSPSLEYFSALARFTALWVSRLATLIENRIDVRSDLTGGVDSRTVVAMLHAAQQLTSTSVQNVGVRSNPVSRGGSTDYQIAAVIAESLGWSINEHNRPRGRRLTNVVSYQSWRRLNLGSYHPVYFPRHSPSFDRVSLGGGGGENHRPFYKDSSFDALVERCARRIPSSWLASQFRNEMKEAGFCLKRNLHDESDLRILHYREFRNRFHTGRAPQQSVLFSPLTSKFLADATASVRGALRHSGQVNYDLMASTAPELLEFEFDNPDKALNAQRRDSLTRVRVASRVELGEVFAGASAAGVSHESGHSPLELLRDEFAEAVGSPVVQDFWGSERVSGLERLLAGFVTDGALGHAIDGQPISAVIASHLVLK